MTNFFFLGMTALVAMPMAAHAAVIDNGTIQLGVDTRGQLNAGGVGLRDLRTGFESIYPGCLCEGWGAAVAETGVTGYANNDAGISNVGFVSFVSDASTATSVSTVGRSLEVTHQFAPSVNENLYQVSVTIRNISGVAISDLRYTRVMDWDIEPTAFSEYVTIGGTDAASAVLSSNTNGFGTGNPLAPDADMGDFVDAGPNDHGAQFNFGFGALASDATYSFNIFYGAAPTEFDAFSALIDVEAEVYSFGQSNDNMDGLTADRSTFIFAFSGVGGDVVPPPPVEAIPVPATAVLLFTAMGALGAMRARRKTA